MENNNNNNNNNNNVAGSSHNEKSLEDLNKLQKDSVKLTELLKEYIDLKEKTIQASSEFIEKHLDNRKEPVVNPFDLIGVLATSSKDDLSRKGYNESLLESLKSDIHINKLSLYHPDLLQHVNILEQYIASDEYLDDLNSGNVLNSDSYLFTEEITDFLKYKVGNPLQTKIRKISSKNWENLKCKILNKGKK